MPNRRGRNNEVDPATDGTADAERRERQSALRRALRERFPDRNRDNLLPVLHLLQHEHRYLPDWALQVVGWHLRVPASEIYGAATSYSELRLDPPARCRVTVCTGLACWQAGGDDLLLAAQRHTDPENQISLATTSCGFICGLAPAMQVNEVWFGRMNLQLAVSAIQSALQ